MPNRLISTLLLALLSLVSSALATPATQPATRRTEATTTQPAATQPATAPAATEAEAVEKQVLALTRQAIQHLQKNKLDEAEPVLVKALKLDPASTINLYNYACLLALMGRPDAAMDHLERAAERGWTDFTHLGRDPDLKSLRDLPRYKALLAKKDAYQKSAAERAVADLRKRFGDGYLYELDADRKLIFATNVDQQTLNELKQWLTAQAASQWADLFAHRPDEFVSVVVPSEADYKKIVKSPGVGGFYNDSAKVLIARRLGQVMTHEFTHALHAADKAPLGQDHPIWVHEGLASLYEAARFDGDRLVPRDNHRLNRIQAAARAGRLIPLAKLLTMEQPAFVRRADLAYGQAGSLMLYLYEHKLLRPFYETFKATFDQDATGKLALERATGRSLDAVEADWRAWMTKRPPVPMTTGGDGVVIGAQLGDATDGLLVDRVVAGGPADRAGVRAGDVVVGLADAQVRDYQSFVPMLVQFKPGDAVRLKVRRDGKYLDLPVTLGRRSEVIDGRANPPGATEPRK